MSLYDVLQIPRTASEAEIKAAYRRLAKEHHPDLNPNDSAAEERFQTIAAAYRILSDPDQRRRYDAGAIDEAGAERGPQGFYRTHADGPDADKYRPGFDPDAFGEMSGLFEDLFGADFFRTARRERRGANVRYDLDVAFMDAARGGRRTVILADNRTIEITIPAGIEHGQIIRVRGQGLPGIHGGPAGDALFQVTLGDHPLFRRDGLDIHIDLPVTMAEAVLGGRIRVPTVHGPVSARLPAGSNTDTVLRLKGKGLERTATGEHGDQLARVKIVLPTRSDQRLSDALEQWQKRTGDDPRADWEGYL